MEVIRCCVLLLTLCWLDFVKSRKYSEGDIRLIGGHRRYMGTVLILHDNKWGAICDDLWGINDATVACRQLGYTLAVRATSRSQFGRGRKRMWLSQMRCRGTEERLADCTFRGYDRFTKYRCPGPYRSAGVICSAALPSAITRRPPTVARRPVYVRRPAGPARPLAMTNRYLRRRPSAKADTPTTTPDITTTMTTTTTTPTTTTPTTTTTAATTTTTELTTTTTTTTKKPTTTAATTTTTTTTTAAASTTTLTTTTPTKISETPLTSDTNESPESSGNFFKMLNPEGKTVPEPVLLNESSASLSESEASLSESEKLYEKLTENMDDELTTENDENNNENSDEELNKTGDEAVAEIDDGHVSEDDSDDVVQTDDEELIEDGDESLSDEDDEDLSEEKDENLTDGFASEILEDTDMVHESKESQNKTYAEDFMKNDDPQAADQTFQSPSETIVDPEEETKGKEKYLADAPPLAEKIEIKLSGGRYKWEGYLEARINEGPWGAICSDHWTMREAMVSCNQLKNLGKAKQALLTSYFGGQDVPKLFYRFKCVGREDDLSKCNLTKIDEENTCSKKSAVAGIVCSEYLPDLIPNLRAVEDSVRLQDQPLYYLRCSMEENCLANSAYVIRNTSLTWRNTMRRLLRFSTVVHNRGTADFKPYLPRGQWQWHSCHMHYHSMEVFAHYDILDSNGTRLASGSKASFCLEDTTCDNGVHPKYNCRGFAEQGLSVNCSDNYMYDIDCQWIDISDIKPGDYTFLMEVNPTMLVAETNFDNNVVSCHLYYNGYFASLKRCHYESLLDHRMPMKIPA